jgi:hypothetical protein
MAGIEQLIQQKEDAYRSNPQALEQKYNKDKQLIDLLAMQKLKSEKESAARDMQLQMQQNPQTIAQQLEQELMTRTKEEAVQQVGDLAKQSQSKKQNNLNKVAAQGVASIKPPTPPAAPTAPQQAPARSQQAPPVRAAQGGIMRYSGGGLTSVTVTPAEIAAYKKRGDPRTHQSMAKLSDADIKERILDQRRVELVRKSNQGALSRSGGPRAIPVSAELAAFDKARAGGETPLPIAPEAGPSVGPVNEEGIPSLLARPEARAEPPAREASVEQAVNTGGIPIDRTSTTTSRVTGPQGGDSTQISAQQGISEYSPAATASPNAGRDGYIQEMLDNFGGPDAQARGTAQQGSYYDEVDRTGLESLYAKQRGALAAYDKAAGSEENNRAARQRATLLGIAQGGLRGGAAADANLRSAQQRNQRKVFKDDLDMEMDAKTKDIEIAQKGMEFGAKAEERQITANNALLQAATSLGRDETTRIENQANRENQSMLSRLKINNDRAIAEMSRVDTTSANASKDKQTNAYLLNDIGDRLKDAREDINAAVLKSVAQDEFDDALQAAKGKAKGTRQDLALQRASNMLAIYRAALEQGSGLAQLANQYAEISKKLGLSTIAEGQPEPEVSIDEVLGSKLLTGENIPR